MLSLFIDKPEHSKWLKIMRNNIDKHLYVFIPAHIEYYYSVYERDNNFWIQKAVFWEQSGRIYYYGNKTWAGIVNALKLNDKNNNKVLNSVMKLRNSYTQILKIRR